MLNLAREMHMRNGISLETPPATLGVQDRLGMEAGAAGAVQLLLQMPLLRPAHRIGHRRRKLALEVFDHAEVAGVGHDDIL